MVRPTVQSDLAIGGVSVCPSHAGNASKLMTAGSCGFHHRLAHENTVFFRQSVEMFAQSVTCLSGLLVIS